MSVPLPTPEGPQITRAFGFDVTDPILPAGQSSLRFTRFLPKKKSGEEKDFFFRHEKIFYFVTKVASVGRRPTQCMGGA
jgi:hypothetical protein